MTDSTRVRQAVLQQQARAIVGIEREYVDDTVANWLPDHVYRLDGVVRSIDSDRQTLLVDFGNSEYFPVDWGTDQLPEELGVGSAIRVLYDPGEPGTASSLWFDGMRH